MNNTSLLFLLRRDPVLTLGAHLAAGILALILLTGAARTQSQNPASSHPATVATVAHR